MATDKIIRKTRPGWNVVYYEGCDKDQNNNPNHATADRITKTWYATRKLAEQA